MTTHRRYYFPHGKWDGDGAAWEQVLTVLQDQCSRNWWYNEPKVTGQPLGMLTFEVTVSAHDQWRCHVKAMALARTCYGTLGLGDKDIPEPIWETLEPHTNRGRFRIPVVPTEEP